MDFSSVPRAIESLSLRQPPFDETIVRKAQELLSSKLSTTLPTTSPDSNHQLFLSNIEYLLTCTPPVSNNTTTTTIPTTNDHKIDEPINDEEKKVNDSTINTATTGVIRWEPLAVGLFVATEVLKFQPVVVVGGGVVNKDVDSIMNAMVVVDQDLSSSTTTATATVMNTVYVDGPRVPSVIPSAAMVVSNEILPILSNHEISILCSTLHECCLKHLEHKEPRIRTLVAKAIGAYAAIAATLGRTSPAEGGVDHWTNIRTMHECLTLSIHEHITAGRDTEISNSNNENSTSNDDEKNDNNKYSRSTVGALDDTTGWRAIETNWLALASLIAALDGQYLIEFTLVGDVDDKKNISQLLQDCEYSSVTHVNRHVRAASMACLEQIIRSCVGGTTKLDPERTIQKHSIVAQLLTDTTNCDVLLRQTTMRVVRAGLEDNWSQVRMASSVLCRVLFTSLQELQSPVDDLYPTLLPRMCLNRFYLAQGVKLYSHETWKIIFTQSGLSTVVEHLPAVCRYYVKMCDADNHAVREAACQAIAELAVRLGEHEQYNQILLDQIDVLIQALLMCFHDESWPVRDEACLACGILCKCYPEACRPELQTLWERWTEQLTDPIWSVREDAAVALGDALEAYGPPFLQKIQELIKEILPAARLQPPMTRAEYKAYMNNIDAHTDSTLYSCGSLAPKLKKASANTKKSGAGRIGCTNCDDDRPRAPWEATDGCIYLIRELCRKCCSSTSSSVIPGEEIQEQPLAIRDDIQLSDAVLLPILTELVDVCRVQHFPQADDLRTTLWRTVPALVIYIGTDRFKRTYLDLFIDLLFRTLESGSRSSSANQLTIHAAGQCLEELVSLLFHNIEKIFRGRLDDDYHRILFDETMEQRRQMKGVGIGCGPSEMTSTTFSPFGPADLLHTIIRKH